MDELKKRFKEDPTFAVFVLVVGGATAAAIIKASAKMIESSAYAYRASKL